MRQQVFVFLTRCQTFLIKKTNNLNRTLTKCSQSIYILKGTIKASFLICLNCTFNRTQLFCWNHPHVVFLIKQDAFTHEILLLNHRCHA